MTRLAKITKAGKIYDVMGSYPNYGELTSGKCFPSSYAVVHFAAIARLLQTSDNECCRISMLESFKVIEGAVEI